MKFKMPPKPKISRRAITALIFVATSLVATVFFAFSLFTVQHVWNYRIAGETSYDAEYLIEACGVERGSALYFEDHAAAEKKLLLAAPRLKKVNIRPGIFSTLVIEVEEEKGAYYSQINGDYYLLSADFRVLEMSSSSEAYKSEAKRFELYDNDIVSAIEGQYIEFKNEKIKSELLGLASEIESMDFGDYGVTSLGFVDDIWRDGYIVLDSRLKIIFGDTVSAKEKIGFALTYIYESGISYEFSQIIVTESGDGYTAYYKQMDSVE